jgi:sulfite reductase (NADPH) hemoprotein beta-component
MKFLVRTMGWDAFRAEVEAELGKVRAEGVPALGFDPAAPPVEEAPADPRPPAPSPEALAARVLGQRPRGPGVVPAVVPDLAPGVERIAAFARSNVRSQKQLAFVSVTVTLPLGDLTSAQLSALADLSRSYADGTVRFTRGQNALLRWVRPADLSALYIRLAAAGLGLPGAGSPADVVACPGAESCRLAVTQSRGLGQLLSEHVRQHPRLAVLAPDLDLNVSGCPNGCSQHHVSTIGFQGSLRKVGREPVPQYFVLLGGGVGPEGARFGRLTAKIPARRVPEALDRLVALYAAGRREGEGAPDFFARVRLDEAKRALAGLDVLTPATLTAEDRIDLGEEQPGTAEGEAPAAEASPESA